MAFKIFISHVWRAQNTDYWGLIRLLGRARRFDFVDLSIPKFRPLDGTYLAVRDDILRALRAADVVLVINTPVITNSEPVQDELMEAERLGIPVIAISPPKRRGASRESQCEVIQRAGYRAQWTAKAIADAIRTAVRAKARVRPVPVVELPQNDYEAADAAADEAVLSHEQVAAVLGDDEDHAAPLKAVLSNDFRSLLVRAPERSHPT